MQTLDYNFIKKYKQKQFAMRHPVPQIVIEDLNRLNSKILDTVVPEMAVQEDAKEVAKEVPKEVAKEVPKEDAKEVAKEDAKEDAKEVAKEAPQMDVQEIAIEVTKNLKSVVITDDDKQTSALQLIKSALEQINFALHLLEELNKKSIADKILPIPEESEPILESESILEDPILKEQIIPSPKSAEQVNIDHISDVEEEIIIRVEEKKQKEKEEEEEEGFKIFMPKKSKNKKVMVTPMILPIKEKTKKDEYPSLSSSFTPIKTTGIWRGGDGKKTLLEISKEIAHIPSPTPVSSPSPNLRKTIRTIKKAVSDGNDSEEDFFEDQNDYQIRKCNDDFDSGY